MRYPLPVLGSSPGPDPTCEVNLLTRLPSAWHFFTARGKSYLFVVEGSRLYEVDPVAASQLAPGGQSPPLPSEVVLALLGIPSAAVAAPRLDAGAPALPPVRSLSLAVTQRCNLSCSYCYAEGGSFGGEPQSMPLSVALSAVEALITGAQEGERVQLAFLGGEPLLNRPVLQAAVRHAERLGRERGVMCAYALTTNGTALREEDADFFEEHRFSITVSLDGVGALHDELRPDRNGGGTFERILRNLRPLLGEPRRRRAVPVSARVSVTPRNIRLTETLAGLLEYGFHSVGFSPVLSSPTGRDQLDAYELEELLLQLTDCAGVCLERATEGASIQLSNLDLALREIHRGSYRAHPCGAGISYLGVSAGGDLYACHRFVEDAGAKMGSLAAGTDDLRRAAWMQERDVHRQAPCRDCWARYLCGGGCHHEVLRRGRPACDYIRGWLTYCLQAYVFLLERQPEFFSGSTASGWETVT